MKSYSVPIQMKAIELYFHLVLFIVLYKVILTFESVDEILKCEYSKPENVLKQYFPLLLCINVTFKPVDES